MIEPEGYNPRKILVRKSDNKIMDFALSQPPQEDMIYWEGKFYSRSEYDVFTYDLSRNIGAEDTHAMLGETHDVQHAVVTWSEDPNQVNPTDTELLIRQGKRRVAEIAGFKIRSVMPVWKQLNALAFAVDKLTSVVLDGATLTPEEVQMFASLRQQYQGTKALRAKSDQLEQQIESIGEDIVNENLADSSKWS